MVWLCWAQTVDVGAPGCKLRLRGSGGVAPPPHPRGEGLLHPPTTPPSDTQSVCYLQHLGSIWGLENSNILGFARCKGWRARGVAFLACRKRNNITLSLCSPGACSLAVRNLSPAALQLATLHLAACNLAALQPAALQPAACNPAKPTTPVCFGRWSDGLKHSSEVRPDRCGR